MRASALGKIERVCASAATPFHVRGAGLGAVSFWESWRISGCLLVLLWGHLGSLGFVLRIDGGPLGSLGVPWGPWESLWGRLGVPWGSLGGPLERLGDEGVRWDIKMSILLRKTEVLGIVGFQNGILVK